MCHRTIRHLDDEGVVPNVVQVMKEHVNHPAEADAATTVRHSQPSNEPVVPNWHEIAERRLAQLVEAEHDVFVSRDHLERLKLECRELLAMKVAQMQRHDLLVLRLDLLMRRHDLLERELASVYASKSWRWSAWLRKLAARSAGAREGAKRMVQRAVKLPFLRPVVRISVRLLPGISTRLHAKLHASRH
jgi:hypothetical protein